MNSSADVTFRIGYRIIIIIGILKTLTELYVIKPETTKPFHLEKLLPV